MTPAPPQHDGPWSRAGHPLVGPAVAMIAGALTAWALEPPAWPFLVGLGLCLAALIGLGQRGRNLPVWLVAVACFCWGCGHLAWSIAAWPSPDHLSLLADNQRHVIVADALEPAEPKGQDWRMLVQARLVDGRPVVGGLRVSFPEGVTPPPLGTRFQAIMRLRPIVNMANPGGFDYQTHARREGVGATAYAGKRSGLAVVGPAEIGPLGLWVGQTRQRLGELFWLLPEGQGRALLRALVLGQRGGMSTQLQDAFGDLGAAHLLSVSGLHVGLVWGLCFGALRLLLAAWPALALRWNAPKTAAMLALGPAAVYVALAGGDTPAVRSLVMIGCLAAAGLANRRYDPLGGLALAALVCVAIWPEAPLTLSFQLSFLAVAAILLAAAPLSRRVARLGRRGWRPLGALAGWLCLSAVVGLAVMPLGMAHFHVVPWLFLPANAVLIPLVAMAALPLALAGAALGLLWPGGGLVVLRAALLPADWAVELALALADLPVAKSFVAGPSPELTVLIYAAALAGLALAGRWRWIVGGGLAALAVALAVIQAQPPAPDGKLTVWLLDVGQGSCAVARTPQGRVMVIDGGGWPDSDFDFGRRVVGPFLWSQGIDRVDVVACSHNHPDHVGGLPFIARWFGPSQVWTNGAPADDGWFGRLLQAAAAGDAALLEPATIARRGVLGGATTLCLWPPPGQDMAGWSTNDQSLWIGLGLGQCLVWLPGDAGPKVERLLAPELPVGGRQVLAAPHHGGKGSCSGELLAALRPELVVFSCGCPNNYGMPRPEAVQSCRAVGARVLSTMANGCVKIVTDGQRLDVSTFLAQPRQCGG